MGLKIGVVLIAAAFLTAQAPIPRPSQPPIESQQAKTGATNNQAQRFDDQRGTEKLPLVVNLKSALDHKTERTEDRASSKEQAVTEKKLADYTWYLFLATVALVLVAVAQAGLFVWQLRDLRKSTTAATTQAQIAQKTLEALERPYVFVFGLSGIYSMPSEGLIPRVRYDVANYGKVAAIIDGIWIVISSLPNGVPEAPLFVDLDHTLMTFPVMAPSEHRGKIVYDLPEGATGMHDGPQFIGAQQGFGLEPNLNPNEDLLAKIIVRYHGPFTTDHVTSIAWRWDQLTGGVVVIPDRAQTFNR